MDTRFVKTNNRKAKVKTHFLKSFCTHVEYCFSIASIHGLNHIVRTNRSIVERLLWACLVAGSFTFGLLKGYEVFMHYDSRPTVMNVEKESRNWKAEFPSLTLCQRHVDQEMLSNVMRKLKNTNVNNDIYDYISNLAFTNMANYDILEKYANGSKSEYLSPSEYLTVLLKIVTHTDQSGTRFPMEEERPVLPVITEFGICSVMNPLVQIYYTPNFFNNTYPYKGYKPLKYNMTTEATVGFQVNKKIYGDYLVFFHSANEIVNIESKPFNAFNGKATHIKIKTMEIYTTPKVRKLHINQRNCKLADEAKGLDHSPLYSYNLCRTECRIKLCLKYCHCTPYYYRRREGEEICNMTGMFCLSRYKDKLLTLINPQTNKSTCSCLQNCDNNLVLLDTVVVKPWFMATMLDIEISQLIQPRFVRNLIFSKLDVLVQVGGIFGLCLGCSILSIIEVIYFTTLRFFWGTIKAKSIKSSL